MIKRPSISIVNYSNTLPLVYGLNHYPEFKFDQVQYHYPAQSAELFLKGEVDLSLLPTGVWAMHDNINRVIDLGICSHYAVESVLIVSHRPLNECKGLILDYQSRTSVILAQIILNDFLNISLPVFEAKPGYEDSLGEEYAAVIIGDRALKFKHLYKFSIDLAVEWKSFTGLPFVFAFWASREEIEHSFLQHFLAAQLWGIEHKAQSISSSSYDDDYKSYLSHYLTNCIHYKIGVKEIESINEYKILAQKFF